MMKEKDGTEVMAERKRNVSKVIKYGVNEWNVEEEGKYG